MTIEYSVSQNDLRIETFPKGPLNIKETFDYFNMLKNDHKTKQGATEIVNFKYVTDFKISYSEGDIIAKYYNELNYNKVISITIFVCETIQAYVIGRMLQTFHDITNPGHKVVVVRSEGGIEKAINEDS
jgi:hypothetical protein